MIIRYVLIMIIAVGLAMPAAAEFYRYKDENGVLRFTDNPEEVPEDQRVNVRRYKESTTVQTGSKDSKQQGGKTKTGKTKSGKTKSGNVSRAYMTPFEKEIDTLNQELHREFKALEAELDEIQTMGEDLKPENRSAYEARRTAYNNRVAAYDAKVKLRDKKVGDYNAEMAKQEAERRLEEERSAQDQASASND